MTNALVFPGQGSQKIGMGKEIFDSFTEAREVFLEIDDALNQHLSKIIFEGDIEELTQTENTQPALMATSIAILKVLEKQGGKATSELASYVAGHSLGEYSALCAAGAFSISDTARLLKTRGLAMQKAVSKGEGAMAAIIGVELDIAEKIAANAANGEACQVANDNSNGQVVISGAAKAIARAEAIAKELGAKKFVKLNVSAPFHCQLMQPAADVMKNALDQVTILPPSIPLIANVSADLTSNPEQIKEFLVTQVTNRVRWRESVQKMHDLGAVKTVEIGSGKVLCGLTKRIIRDMESVSIQTPEDIEKFLL